MRRMNCENVHKRPEMSLIMRRTEGAMAAPAVFSLPITKAGRPDRKPPKQNCLFRRSSL